MSGDIRERIARAIESGDGPAFARLAGELFDAHVRALRDVGTGALGERRAGAFFEMAPGRSNRMYDRLQEGGAPGTFGP